MFKTIKIKFLVLSLAIIILSIGIPVGFLLNQVSKNFHERSVLMVDAALDLMIDGLNNSMMKGDQKNIHKIVKHISDNRFIEHIRIFNKLGIISYSNIPTELGKNINVIAPGLIESNISSIVKRNVYLDKKTKIYKAIQPIVIEKRCQSCHKENKIISYLDIDTNFTEAEINFYTGSVHMVIWGIVLIFILAVVFYLFFNRFINKPLNDFMDALGSVEKGNLDITLPSTGSDEFSILNNHFNRMVNELKDSREKIDEMHFEQLQRADKMVTLGELTSTMAHDINNYSAIIMSRADYLLLEAKNDNVLNVYKEDLNVINDQIEKISKITGNILTHSKKTSKDFCKFDLVKVIENSLKMLEPLAKKRKVNLSTGISVNEAIIYGNENQLEQVVINLISNALDALPDGGDINILLFKNDDGKLQLSVKDNGIGIDEDSMSKIFSPFYTKKGRGKGTGLGLYIVQNICNSHSAEIKCDSELNVGTTFTITFSEGAKND